MDRKSSPIDQHPVFTALLASPTTVLVAADLAGAVTAWSVGAERVYGWTSDEIVGQPLTMLVPPDRVGELALRDRLLAGEEVPPLETVLLNRDGHSVDVEMHWMVLRDLAGQAIGTLAVHRDLRADRRLQQAVRERDEELRARFAESPVPQSRVDLEGRILETNAALRELLGRPAEELDGSNAVELYTPEARPAVREALARLVSQEVTSLAQEHDVLGPDGARVRTVTSVALMHDGGGHPQLAASVVDVTALRAAEERIRVEAARYEALLESMPVVVFTYDLDGRCTSSRGQALAELGLEENELVGADLLEMYAAMPDVEAALRAPLRGEAAQAHGTEAGREWRGDYRPLRDGDGAVVGGIGIAVDVTDLVTAERERRASEARLSSLLQYASDVALVVDRDGRITYVSPSVTGHLGYDPDQLLGRSAWDFDHPDDRGAVEAGLREIVGRRGATARFECRVLHADGSWRWADHVLTDLLDDPAVQGLVVNVRESTARRRAEEELRRLAVRDPLTGLANRTLLLDRIGQALVAGRRSGDVTGLVVLDVVGMSELNDALGQEGGDQVLRVLAARLVSALRDSDSAARVGGDEFAVLVDDVGSAEDLRALAASLVEVTDEPVDIDGAPVPVRLQAGSSVSPADDAGALLAAAEQAIPHDVRSRRVVVRSATSEGELAQAREAAVERLRAGIGSGELELHFQPVVRLDTQEPIGAEALVRWQHPGRGLLGPSDFIPLAEQSGLVVELGEWVLRAAVERIAAWYADGRALAVGVNLSPRQLVGEAFPDLVRTLLAQTGVPPELLILEVTESALMDDPGAPGVLRLLRQMGVRLALDDFGTGYSSLTYLKKFPVDAIKIDRSFVSGLGRDADDEAIVTSVVSLARAVGKTVIAEGVETGEQLDALRALGVDQAQGFLWSRALPADEIERWLDANRAAPLPARRRRPARLVSRAASSGGADEERILVLHAEGASLHTIAAALNAEGRRTPAGPRWTTKTVARVVADRLAPRLDPGE
ncbi:MAG: EAL domain-containing protein [Frankiales bacterium]|nr:MAG: EAL domain-containing protein [Frankiales bacterium]